ncbi:S-adenosyl-L-methionine-dependent methyltransferase [Lentinula edodes]|nr:S-adenosyl-L-methionine-dependent methyltransferase [Lentinula edodes]
MTADACITNIPAISHFDCFNLLRADQNLQSSVDTGVIDSSFTTESAYILPSDEPERQRYPRSHQSRFMTKAVFGGRLISVPSLTISPGHEILESATGTGIWLLDLAHQLPFTISLTGIDISTRLFPKSTTYPSNITFSSQSITDLPPSWSNRFTLINQRLLTGALSKPQWIQALTEIYRVLKPGGWIQFMETGPTPNAYSGAKMKRMVDSWALLYRARGLVPEIQNVLGQLITETGFIEMQKHIIPLPLSPRRDSSSLSDSELDHYEEHKKNIIGFFVAAKQPFLMAGLFKGEVEFDQALEEMREEWDASEGCWWEWAIFYAKKPE